MAPPPVAQPADRAAGDDVGAGGERRRAYPDGAGGDPARADGGRRSVGMRRVIGVMLCGGGVRCDAARGAALGSAL